MTQPSNTQCCVEACGGTCEATTITHEVKRGARLYVFENVPATICGKCRELWIDEEVLQEIDTLIEYGVPIQKIETPVYDFSRAPAPAH
jgi:YgiT-type zinc finger domain-containing protein